MRSEYSHIPCSGTDGRRFFPAAAHGYIVFRCSPAPRRSAPVRGFDTLTVSATNDPAVSRITLTITSDDRALKQLILQTERLEVTRQVFVLDKDKTLQRELLLLKVASDVHNRAELREIANIYKAKIIDLSPDSMVFELTGRPEKIDAFLKMFEDYEILEQCRTGVTALERGGMHQHMQKPPQEVRAAQLPLPGTHCPERT